MVAGAGGNADERKPVRERGCGDDGERPVAAGDAERIRAARHGLVDQRCEVVVRAQDDHVDAALARPLGEAGARALPPPDLGLTNSTGRRGGAAAAAAAGRHPERRSRSERRGCSVGGS